MLFKGNPHRHHRSNITSSKSVSIFMILLLIVSVLLAVPVYADVVTPVNIVVDNKTIQPNDTADIGVSVQGLSNTYLAGYDFTIKYDPSLIQVTGLKGTNDFAAPTLPDNGVFQVTTPGAISVTAAQSSGTNGNLILFYITVKALGQAGKSDINLTVNDGGFSDEGLLTHDNLPTSNTTGFPEDIPYAVTNGSVTVGQSNPTPPAAPNVSADDVNNVITGIDSTMEYKIDNGIDYITYDSANPPDLSGNHTVNVRVKATSTMPAGLDAVLTFTDNGSSMPTPTLVVKPGFAAASESRVEVKLATQNASNYSVSVLGTQLFYSSRRDMFVGIVPSVDQTAMQNGISVTASSPSQIKYGDVTNDGNINVLDAIAVVKISTGRTTNPTVLMKLASDVTGDGSINVLDAIQIVKKATGRVQDLTIDTMK